MILKDNLRERLEAFINSSACQHAIRKLSKKATIGILVGEQSFTFHNLSLRDGISEKRDLDLQITVGALSHILTLENQSSDDIGKIGIEIVKSLIHSDPEQKSHIRIKASLLTLMKNGYFSVASTGGKDFFKFLASKGLGNMRKIQEKIRELMK